MGGSFWRKQAIQHPFVDDGQPFQVYHRNLFVGLVHGTAHQTKLYRLRANPGDEAGVGSTAAGGKLWGDSQGLTNGISNGIQ